MTPRSRRYFDRKRASKYQKSVFAASVSFIDALMLVRDACMEVVKPKRIYPNFDHPGGAATVGESGPEVVIRQDLWDVKIKMPFTLFAEGTYVKIDKS